MDWQKTKSILIAALIITNLILFYSIYDSKTLFSRQVVNGQEEWVKVIELIREKSVHYNGERVEGPDIMKGVKLEYQIYDPEDMAYRLLGDFEIDTGIYKGEAGGQVTLEGGNKLIYTKQGKPNKGSKVILKDEEAIRLADSFLDKAMLTSSDARLWDIARDNELVSIIYRQYDKELFLDDAFMTITLEGNEIIKFERKWFNASVELDYERKIIKPAKALYRAVDQMLLSGEEQPVVVEKLELGYRLDSSTLVTSVKSGEASPYWRLLTKNGNVYYIEAME